MKIHYNIKPSKIELTYFVPLYIYHNKEWVEMKSSPKNNWINEGFWLDKVESMKLLKENIVEVIFKPDTVYGETKFRTVLYKI